MKQRPVLGVFAPLSCDVAGYSRIYAECGQTVLPCTTRAMARDAINRPSPTEDLEKGQRA